MLKRSALQLRSRNILHLQIAFQRKAIRRLQSAIEEATKQPVSDYEDPPLPKLEVFRQLVETDREKAWEIYNYIAPAELVTEDDYFLLIRSLVSESRQLHDARICQIFEDMKSQGYLSSPGNIGQWMLHELMLHRSDRVIKIFEEYKSNVGDTSGANSELLFYCALTAFANNSRINEEIISYLSIEKPFNVSHLNSTTYATTMSTHLNPGSIRNTQKLINVLKDDLVKPNTEVFTSNVQRMFDQRQFEKALALYEKISKQGPLNEFTYGVFIKGFVSLFKMKIAIRVWNDMIKSGLRPNSVVYNSMLDGFAKRGDVESAEKLFDRMRSHGAKSEHITYGIMISLYFKKRNVEKAMAMFEEMGKAGIQPRIAVCNSIIEGLYLNRKPEVVEKFLEYMRSIGLKEDMITFNTRLREAIYRGNTEAAMKVIQEMSQLGMKPDVWTFTTLIGSFFNKKDTGGYFLANDVSQLEEKRGKILKTLIQDMHSLGIQPNIATFTVIIDGLAKRGNMEAADLVFEQMQGMGIRPNVRTYTSMMQGYIDAGEKMDKVYQLLTQMSRLGVQPSPATYHTLMTGCFRERDLEGAMDIYKRMKATEVTIHKQTYLVLLSYLIDGRHKDVAKQVIEDMKAANFEVESPALRRLIKSALS